MYQPATIMLYDNEIKYIFSLTKLNDITTEKHCHSTTWEMFKRTKILWESLGRPNAQDKNRKKSYV